MYCVCVGGVGINFFTIFMDLSSKFRNWYLGLDFFSSVWMLPTKKGHEILMYFCPVVLIFFIHFSHRSLCFCFWKWIIWRWICWLQHIVKGNLQWLVGRWNILCFHQWSSSSFQLCNPLIDISTWFQCWFQIGVIDKI